MQNVADPEATRMLRLLGVHPGPEFSVGAAAALAGGTTDSIRPVLDSLVKSQLLEHSASDRYRLPDQQDVPATANQIQQREESKKEQRGALSRVLRWYLYTADAAARHVAPEKHRMPITLDSLRDDKDPVTFIDDRQAIQWYEAERTNLIAATHVAATAGFDQIAWQIPVVVSGICDNRDPASTWLAARQTALTAVRRSADRYSEAVLLDRLGVTFRLSHRLPEAIDHYRAALDIFTQLGDQLGRARCLNGLGLTYHSNHQLAEARHQFEEGMAIAQQLGNRPLLTSLLSNLGHVFFDLGESGEAEALLRQAITMLDETDEPLRKVTTLRHLSATLREQGQLAEARQLIQQALTIANDHNNSPAESSALLEYAQLKLAEGTPDKALTSAQRAVTLFRQLGHSNLEARALDIAGEAHQQLGHPDKAANCYQQAETIRNNHKHPR